jgi:hypothetical protein
MTSYLEVVETFHVSSKLVDLGVVFLLDVTDGLGKFTLPEFTVLGGCVSVSEGGKFFKFLQEKQRQIKHFVRNVIIKYSVLNWQFLSEQLNISRVCLE